MKRKFFVGIISAIAVAFAISGNAWALVDTPWGPERATFTWADPAPYATFNSITDNPQLGDERNFVRVWKVADNMEMTDDVQLSELQDEVELEVGKTYGVYIYYHNNADAHDVGQTAKGIADGAGMKSSFPATIAAGEKGTVTGTIVAANTNPTSVWDGAYLKSNQDVYLRYVTGSAVIHNGGELNKTSIGSDYLFGSGAALGYNILSGILPGCNQYAGYVTYWVYVDAPNFNVKKTVVNQKESYRNGETVTFKVRYENTGTMDQNNVVIRDTLPEGLTYVPGSAKLYNNNLVDGKDVNDDVVSENGMNIGDYAGGSGWAELVYSATIDNKVACDASLTNDVLVSTNDGNKHDKITIRVWGDDCVEPGKEIPKTGPAEIVLASVIVLGAGGVGFYLYRTRKTLKMVETTIKGEDVSGDGADGGSQKPDNMVK